MGRIVASFICGFGLSVGSIASADFLERAPLRSAIGTGFLSYHHKDEETRAKKNYNETNTGFAYRSQKGLLLGFYQNSFYKNSFYVTKEALWTVSPYIRVGGLAGVVTGGYDSFLMPVVLPEVVLSAGRAELAVSHVPRVNDTGGVTMAQLRWALD